MVELFQRLTQVVNRPEFFREGFVVGFLVGVLLVLILILALMVWHRRYRSHGVVTRGENGDLLISANAIREFVSRVLSEYNEATLNSVRFLETRTGLVLSLSLDLLPDTPVVPLVERIRSRVIQQAADKVGIDRPLRVNVVVRSLMARDRRPVRGSKPGPDLRGPPRPYPPAETTPAEEA